MKTGGGVIPYQLSDFNTAQTFSYSPSQGSY